MRELREAAEAVVDCYMGRGTGAGGLIQAMEQLRAALDSTADDAEPMTEDRLRSVGFYDDGFEDGLMLDLPSDDKSCAILGNGLAYKLLVKPEKHTACLCNYVGESLFGHAVFPFPVKTVGDLRRVARGCGVPLKEGR